MPKREFIFSSNLEEEFQILEQATRLSEGELIQKAIALLRIHVEAASDGREIRILGKASQPEQVFELPFKLQGPYTTFHRS